MTKYTRLGPGDAECLAELNGFLARVFPDPDIVGCEGTSPQQRDSWLAQDSNVALVAMKDAAIVGGLVAYRFDKIEGRREFYIYDLAVDEASRREGVATRLIDTLCEIAREVGAWTVYVQSFKQDAPAVALYRKVGTCEDVLHFDIDPSKRIA